MKTNHKRKPTKLVALLASAAMLGLVSQSALAANNYTLSGTDITNLAKLSYSVGGTPQNEICSAPGGNSVGNGGTTGTTCVAGANGATVTTFKVDNKINVAVTEGGVPATAGANAGVGAVTTVLPGASGQVTAFTVTNNGNTAQGYTLVAADGTGGSPTVQGVTDTINTTAITVFVESGATPGYQVLEDTATQITTLAPDASQTVYVVATIPALATNGQQAAVTLTATTTDATTMAALAPEVADDPLTVQNVFADPAIVAAANQAGNTARDAIGVAVDAYRVSSSIISVAKTATLLCDPINGITNPKNIPGAIVQWTITVNNTGGASATLATISDTLSGSTTHEPGTAAAGLTAPTDAATCVAGAGTQGSKITATPEGADARPLGGAAGSGNMTNAAAPADGADVTAGVVTINFADALPGGTVGATTWANGELKPGATTTVKFNVTIN